MVIDTSELYFCRICCIFLAFLVLPIRQTVDRLNYGSFAKPYGWSNQFRDLMSRLTKLGLETENKSRDSTTNLYILIMS